MLEKVGFYQVDWVYFDFIGLFFVLCGCDESVQGLKWVQDNVTLEGLTCFLTVGTRKHSRPFISDHVGGPRVYSTPPSNPMGLGNFI